MNNLKVTNIYLQIYKENGLIIKTQDEFFLVQWIKKKFSFFSIWQLTKRITNIPQGNKIVLENDMRAVKMHEGLKSCTKGVSFRKQKWHGEMNAQGCAKLKAYNDLD